jgi:site-specific recombinase XerC
VLLREAEIDTNPMDGARAPIVAEQPIDVHEVTQLKALLDSCKANDLMSRRDNAIIRLLIDTGSVKSLRSRWMTSTSTRASAMSSATGGADVRCGSGKRLHLHLADT